MLIRWEANNIGMLFNMRQNTSIKSARKTFQPDDERQLVMDLRTPIDIKWLRKQAMKQVYLLAPTRPYRKKK